MFDACAERNIPDRAIGGCSIYRVARGRHVANGCTELPGPDVCEIGAHSSHGAVEARCDKATVVHPADGGDEPRMKMFKVSDEPLPRDVPDLDRSTPIARRDPGSILGYREAVRF